MAKTPNKDIKQTFLNDTKDHQMTIKEDTGVYRNLVFSNNGSSIYGFGIQTWPGHLCIYGDMGTFVFSRIEDMFCFFRNRNKELEINPGYWHEKMVADSQYCGSQEFSEDLCKKHIKEDFDNYLESNDLSEEEKKELWNEIEWEVIEAIESGGEARAYDAAMDFKTKDKEYIFQDFWEYNCKEYTHQFLWCLYAIVWAIQQYDSLMDSKDSKDAS